MGDYNSNNIIITGDPLGLWEHYPSDWQEYKLWDLAEYINGRAFKPTDFSPVGLPVIKITALKYGLSPSTNLYSGEYDEKYLLKTGDLLFAWSGNPETSLDAFRWRGGKALLNQHIFRVIPRDNNIDKTYQKFTQKVAPLFKNIQVNKDQSRTLASIRDALLPKLLSGEIRVKDAGRFVEGVEENR
ncbi:MAG: restriction endonuclease subunit S [Nitrospirota bacterium]